MLKVNVKKFITVWCDQCKKSVVMFDDEKQFLVTELRRRGWSIGRNCLCPVCKKTPEQWARENMVLAHNQRRGYVQYEMNIGKSAPP